MRTASTGVALFSALAVFLTASLLPRLAQSDTSAASDEALDRRLQALYHQIRCPVCPAQPISESEAPLSRILRQELREQIASGKSDQEALSWLVERYGEKVLLQPRFRSAAPLWLAPLLGVIIALAVLHAYTKRRRRRR